MSKVSQHVVPNSNGGWGVKKSGSEKNTRNFGKKQEAIAYAKVVSKKQGVEMVVHKKDGRIENPNSYGNDPNPPKDKKH